jgi:hypothetical protein
MGADEGVGEVRVLVYLELPAVKRGVPARVALKTLAGEVAGRVGVATHAADHEGVES